MRRVMSTILIIIGILLLLSPLIKDLIIKFHSWSINNRISNETIIANNQNSDLEAEFDFSAIKDVDLKSAIMGPMDFNGEFVIGTISIPGLNIYLPIMKGITDANLMAGAATMKPDQSFGMGNFTLAGHRMKNKDLLFGRLMEIEKGEKVLISDGERIYEYIIYDTAVVQDTDIDMLSDDKSTERGKPIVSLMTCYYSSKTGKRFFALGELVDTYSVSLEPSPE